jgi:hypothetical protein
MQQVVGFLLRGLLGGGTQLWYLRDISIHIAYSHFAVPILIGSILYARPLFPRLLSAALITINVLGVVISLTRTEWVGLAVAVLVMGAIFSAGSMRRLAKVTTYVVIAASVAVLLMASFFTLEESQLDLLALLRERTVIGTSFSDIPSIRGRLAEAKGTITSMQGIEFVVGKGLGWRLDWFNPTKHEYDESYYMHNAYIFYFSKGGALLLLAVALLLAKYMREGIRMSRPGADPHLTAAALGLTSGLAALIVGSLAGGYLSRPDYAPFWGVSMGLLNRIWWMAQMPATKMSHSSSAIVSIGPATRFNPS